MTVWAAAPAPAPAPEASDGPPFADLYDGASARRRRVAVEARDGALRLLPPEGDPLPLDPARLHRVPDQGRDGPTVFAHDRARIVAADAAAALLAAHATGRGAPAPILRRALLTIALCAAALAAIVTFGLPTLAGLLAPRLSAEAEVALGDAHWDGTRALFGRGIPLRECDDPAGRAALDALTARVAAPLDLPYDLRVAVLDDRRDPILNAYATAGGRVAFLDSMIQAAESPDEIAAVLAHELGHVVNDDPVRGLLQSASALAVLSVLAGDVTGGGLLGGVGAASLNASYTRGAEEAADRFAADLLAEVGLPRAALGRMFERLRDAHGEAEGLLAHFATHPEIAARLEALADLPDPPHVPALTDAQWADLRGICGPVAAPDPLR